LVVAAGIDSFLELVKLVEFALEAAVLRARLLKLVAELVSATNQLADIRKGFLDLFVEAETFMAYPTLRKVCDSRALGNCPLSEIRFGQAGDNAHKGSLAASVGTRKGGAALVVEGKVDILQDIPIPKGDLDLGNLDATHCLYEKKITTGERLSARTTFSVMFCGGTKAILSPVSVNV
jgi:hypothetical protein